jgi:hypothetical protein
VRARASTAREGGARGEAPRRSLAETQTLGQKVLIIDGGSKESGEALVKHVTEVYGTGTVDESLLRRDEGVTRRDYAHCVTAQHHAISPGAVAV